MKNTFAKLFDTEVGQILVIVQSSDDGDPEIRFFAKPDVLGVCSVALTYEDTDAGWGAAESAFEKIDVDMSLRATRQLFEIASQLKGGA